MARSYIACVVVGLVLVGFVPKGWGQLGLPPAFGVGNWAAELHLGWQAFAVVTGFVVGNDLAGQIPFLRRLVVSENGVEEEVRQAAG